MRERTVILPRLLGFVVLVAVVTFIVGCGGSGNGLRPDASDATRTDAGPEETTGPCDEGSGDDAGSSDASDASDSAEATDSTDSRDTQSLAKRILDCVSPSVVFIETPIASGSGVLLDDGYIVTNAHVVDPYASAWVTIEGDTEEDVPVVGVDLLADIAVLGPIDNSSAAAEFGELDRVEKGDTVFLVGYPGEVDSAPEATISQGIVSRIRKAENFDQKYIQTDAAIGGGQSGGALVDEGGRVLGISGLSFAEEFALALSAGDVRAAIDAIKSGDSDEYRPLPESRGVREGTVTLVSGDDTEVLILPAATSTRTVTFTLPADRLPAFEVYALYGEVLYVNQEAIDNTIELTDIPADQLGYPEPDVPASPGVFEVEVPEGIEALVYIGTRKPEGATMPFLTTTGVIPYKDRDENAPIAVGDRVQGAIDALELTDTFMIDLAAGDTIDVFVGSPTGDPAYRVIAPGQRVIDAEYVDDSGEGLYDTDAHDEFEAEAAGTYVIEVSSNLPFASGYILEVKKS